MKSTNLNPTTSPRGSRRATAPLAGLAIVYLAALLGSVACTSARGSVSIVTDLSWPADSPKIRLERVLTPRGSRAGRLLRLFTGEESQSLLRRPYGVTWDGQDLLLTDPGAGAVLRVDSDGSVLANSGPELSSPIGIASCARGIVVTDSRLGEVLLLGPDLRIRERLATGLARPTGVACDGHEIFVAETGKHRVQVLSEVPGDQPVRSLGRRGNGPGELNFPTSLVLDGTSLWVSDTLNFRVQRFDTATGAALGTFGRLGDSPGDMPRVKGLAVDAAGRVWVADAHLDSVSLFRRDGTYLMTVGGTGTGTGAFSFPAGIAAGPNGSVAVVDSFNRRIQVFDLLASTSQSL